MHRQRFEGHWAFARATLCEESPTPSQVVTSVIQVEIGGRYLIEFSGRRFSDSTVDCITQL
jgi:hypothetical protein